MNALIELIKNANSISTNMFANSITIDDTEHKLYGGVLHSNWNKFNVSGRMDASHYDTTIHGLKYVNKELKVNIAVDSYFNIVMIDGDDLKSITIEYNSNEASWSN